MAKYIGIYNGECSFFVVDTKEEAAKEIEELISSEYGADDIVLYTAIEATFSLTHVKAVIEE